jgi:hypothetical protein
MHFWSSTLVHQRGIEVYQPSIPGGAISCQHN